MRLMLALALIAPSAAVAASDPAPTPLPSEFRLSDAERERILEEAAAKNRGQGSAPSEPAEPQADPARQIHGEVGFSIGTGGYRSAYGTTYVPVGDDGVAIITLDSTDFGSRRRYYGPWPY